MWYNPRDERIFLGRTNYSPEYKPGNSGKRSRDKPSSFSVVDTHLLKTTTQLPLLGLIESNTYRVLRLGRQRRDDFE